MRLTIFAPASDLGGLVRAYWLCRDSDRALMGRPLRVTPGISTVLCIQLGDPVETDFAARRPRAALTGLQTKIRSYTPTGAARSLLVFLTPHGTARLFPGRGPDIVGDSPDLSDLLGDAEVGRLRRAAEAAPDERLASTVDAWLRKRLDRIPEPTELRRFTGASALLRQGLPVAEVAAKVELSIRQLERIFESHVGLGPKRFQHIHRFQMSLHAKVTGLGDPLAGYADQAHQIRNWRAYLDMTPGRLGRAGLSSVAAHFLALSAPEMDAYVHYL